MSFSTIKGCQRYSRTHQSFRSKTFSFTKSFISIMIHELRQPLEAETDLGHVWLIIFIDYGPLENSVFVGVVKSTGEIKHFSSNQVKLLKNNTFDIRTE